MTSTFHTVVVILWLLWVAGKTALTLLIGISAMLFHEVGHYVAAYFMGVKVKSVSVEWKGIAIVREAGSDLQNLVVSAAGPLANLVLMLVFWKISPLFSLANFLFFGLNILPVRTSDGDRIWDCWTRLRATKVNRLEMGD